MAKYSVAHVQHRSCGDSMPRICKIYSSFYLPVFPDTSLPLIPDNPRAM